MLAFSNAQELAQIAKEIGALVLHDPLQYPGPDSGDWKIGIIHWKHARRYGGRTSCYGVDCGGSTGCGSGESEKLSRNWSSKVKSKPDAASR